jgi:hypothetical protein
MSSWNGIGRNGTSNGQFWYGNTTNFPGFLYKKNLGVGTRKSTKLGPGGNITCNQPVYLYNKYKPGTSGVGATSTAVRRAKNRSAAVCQSNQCGQFYNYLGRYDNYTGNPNGYFPYPPAPSSGALLAKFNSPATVGSFGVLNSQKPV